MQFILALIVLVLLLTGCGTNKSDPTASTWGSAKWDESKWHE